MSNMQQWDEWSGFCGPEGDLQEVKDQIGPGRTKILAKRHCSNTVKCELGLAHASFPCSVVGNQI